MMWEKQNLHTKYGGNLATLGLAGMSDYTKLKVVISEVCFPGTCLYAKMISSGDIDDQIILPYEWMQACFGLLLEILYFELMKKHSRTPSKGLVLDASFPPCIKKLKQEDILMKLMKYLVIFASRLWARYLIEKRLIWKLKKT